ncbi:MAG: hypothetical protein ACFFKA_16975 [Candidatus Thorarchaeota archaeon]
MIDSNPISVMLNSLDSNDREVKSTLENLIKFVIKVAYESEEIQDELLLYDDLYFHIYIYDIDFNIWIKKFGAILTFNTSYYENVPKEMNIIHYILSKKTIKRIFTQRLNPADAYMKGLVQIQGNLSNAIITRNLLKVFFQYINFYITQQT